MSEQSRIFHSVCRVAYISRGLDAIEKAVMDCTNACELQFGTTSFKIEGLSVAVLPDQSAVVTLLASAGIGPVIEQATGGYYGQDSEEM